MAFGFIVLSLVGLASVLLWFSGQIGKPPRAKALPRGTAPRPRSREEILRELRQGQVSLDNAIRAAEEGFFRTRLELERAKQDFQTAIEEVSHAA